MLGQLNSQQLNSIKCRGGIRSVAKDILFIYVCVWCLSYVFVVDI